MYFVLWFSIGRHDSWTVPTLLLIIHKSRSNIFRSTIVYGYLHTFFTDKGRFNPINKCVLTFLSQNSYTNWTGPGTRVRLELKLRAVSSYCIYCLIVSCVVHITHKRSLLHKGHQVKLEHVIYTVSRAASAAYDESVMYDWVNRAL